MARIRRRKDTLPLARGYTLKELSWSRVRRAMYRSQDKPVSSSMIDEDWPQEYLWECPYVLGPWVIHLTRSWRNGGTEAPLNTQLSKWLVHDLVIALGNSQRLIGFQGYCSIIISRNGARTSFATIANNRMYSNVVTRYSVTVLNPLKHTIHQHLRPGVCTDCPNYWTVNLEGTFEGKNCVPHPLRTTRTPALTISIP